MPADRTPRVVSEALRLASQVKGAFEGGLDEAMGRVRRIIESFCSQ